MKYRIPKATPKPTNKENIGASDDIQFIHLHA